MPNGDFYKLQREIRSNQVLKKDSLAIQVAVEQEVESQKVESPGPLETDEYQASPLVEEKRLHLPERGSELEQHESHWLATEQDDKEGLPGELHCSTQLFRTQKMAGLALLSQQATQQIEEGLGESDPEMDHKFGSQIDEDDEDEEGDLPASSAVLGMRLGEHMRKNSDGKSSIVGLSALGL